MSVRKGMLFGVFFAWLEFPCSSKEKQKLGKRKVHILPLEGAGTSSSLQPQASYALASKPTLAHLCCRSCAAFGLLSLLLK